ncbi:hypothetical protein EB796_006484 [Bugula neritina]|uniref:Uncharacterized protein n=1 Tax=Bugula neritina TaxID=10212 RepID=A0A7J7KC89_BUGNE|nr:hypothetical protein EB796_006484 [Bugula neritina]
MSCLALLLPVGKEEVPEVCEQIEAYYPSTVTLEPSCTSALYRVFRVEVSGGNRLIVPDPTAASARPREPQTELDRFMDLMDLTSSSDEEEPDPGEFMLHNQYNYIIYVT